MVEHYPCVCGEQHIKKKYADLHSQQVLNRIKRREGDNVL